MHFWITQLSFRLLLYVKNKAVQTTDSHAKHIYHGINSKAESVPAGTFLPSQPKPLKVVVIMIILLKKARGILPANLFVSVLANAPSRLINSLTELFQPNKICISHLLNFPAATDNFLINKHSFCQDRITFCNPVQLAGIKRRARNKSRKYRLQSPVSPLIIAAVLLKQEHQADSRSKKTHQKQDAANVVHLWFFLIPAVWETLLLMILRAIVLWWLYMMTMKGV